MKNIYNWLFGSFFRTLGRVLVYIIFGIILSYLLKDLNLLPEDFSLLSISNVYAETVPIEKQNVTINGSSSYSSSGYYNSYFGTTGTDIQFQLMCDLDYLQCYNYVAVVTDVCVGDNVAKLTRAYGYGQSCPNSCFTQNPTFTDLGRSCNVNNSTSGLMYRLYMPISKWNIGSGNVRYYTLDDKVSLYSKYIGTTYTITNLYFTDTMVSSEGQWNTLNSSIDSLNSSINNASSQAHTDSQNVQNKLDSVNNSQKETNDLIKSDNTSEAENKATDFFTNFTTDNHGLTGIITAPLNAIQSLSSATCTPLELPLPFVNDNLTLPCMRPIYEEHFGSFMNIYDIITLGIISYWIMVRIFSLVKDFKNPDHDEIEVVDL